MKSKREREILAWLSDAVGLVLAVVIVVIVLACACYLVQWFTDVSIFGWF